MWQGIPSSASISSDHKDNAFVFERLINVSKDISDTFSNLFLRLTFFIPSSIINRIIDLIHLLDPWLNLLESNRSFDVATPIVINSNSYRISRCAALLQTKPTLLATMTRMSISKSYWYVMSVETSLHSFYNAHNIARSLIIDTSLNWKRCLRLKKYPINSR